MYTGEFEKGNKCGQGHIQMLNGVVYEGQWLDNLPHGQGKVLRKTKDNLV